MFFSFSLPLPSIHRVHLVTTGCGKTSACFSLAASRFVIYLECPADGEQALAGSCRGYRLSKVKWWGSNLSSEESVLHLFCCEVAARLVVLVNLLRRHGAAVSPRFWLRFVQSGTGEQRIGRAFDGIVRAVGRVTPDLVQELLTDVHKLQALHCPAGELSPKPVLFVDEVQLLAPMHDVTCSAQSTGGPITAIKAMIRTAGLLSWGAVWSGTRMDLTAANGQNLGVAKQMKGSRGPKVVGDFQYLEPETVNTYLDAVLAHSASEGMRRQLCHLLQGRAGMVTGYIALLLTPVRDEKDGGLSMRGAGMVRLDDEILRGALEEFMESLVVRRYLDEKPSGGLRSEPST